MHRNLILAAGALTLTTGLLLVPVEHSWSQQKATKIVTNQDQHGWMRATYKNPPDSRKGWEKYPSLPQFLRVEFLGRSANRDRFIIREGLSRIDGREASIEAKPDGSSWLAPAPLPKEPAKVKFNRKTSQLWYGPNFNTGPINDTVTFAGDPVPAGVHDLEIPDEPHPRGESYLTQSRFATTWFRIGHSGERFLHAGSASAGCVTVRKIPEWNNIYAYLILSRKGDGKSVGTLTVVDK